MRPENRVSTPPGAARAEDSGRPSILSGRAILAAVLVLEAAIGVGLVLYAADPSPTGSSDSVAYLVAARNFLAGRGMGLHQASGDFSPMLVFPPIYSAVLAVPVAFGMDVLAGARWVNAFLLGVFILLAGLLAHGVRRNEAAAIGMAGLVLFTPGLTSLFISVQSEALFLPLILACLLLLIAGGIPSQRRVALAGGLASLAILTRYAGIALLIAGPAILLLDRRVIRWERARRAMIFGATALSLPLLRSAYMGLKYGAVLPRAVEVTPLSWDSLQALRGDMTLSLWKLLPFASVLPRLTYYQMLVGLAAIVLFLAGMVVVAKRKGVVSTGDSGRPGQRWLGLAVFIVVYVMTLGATYTFSLAKHDINYRILSPAQVPVWMILLFPLLVWTEGRKKVRWLVPAVLLAAALVGFPRTREIAVQTRLFGGGLITDAWRRSETVEYVRRELQGAVVSNETAALQLWASRPAYDVMDVITPTQAIKLRYGDDPDDPAQVIFRDGSAHLVLFDSIHGQLIAIYGEDAEERYEAMIQGLEIVADLGDGTIYRYPP